MKKLVIFLFIGVSSLLKAEEGMIIPTLLEAFESDMQAMGMKISAKDIYDANNASIKDAIIHFGGGCTAEIVSKEALLLTNHHCGFSQINAHSTLENNYLKYGFWAKNKAEELSNPGLTASRMVKIEDVTSRVLAGTENLSASELRKAIQTNIALIKAEAIKGNHFIADIKPFDFGNSYFLLVKETFTDIRLVGAPPSTVGKFGGDTDNWVWPRHTGDFSVFRIYAGADNKPAEYSLENKPYKPLHHLPISLKDRKDGDFTMVFGFPGSTEQHTISNKLDFIINKERPARIKMRDLSLSVIKPAMRLSELTTLQYASKQSRIANAWKKWIGQIDGLKRNDAVLTKKKYETSYNNMANSNPEWKEKYGSVVNDLNTLFTNNTDIEFAYSMFIEYYYVGAESLKSARNLEKYLANPKNFKSNKEIEILKEKLLKGSEGFFKNYDLAIDKRIFKLQTTEYMKQVKAELIPNELKSKSVADYADCIYKKSIFTNKAKYQKFIAKLNEKSIKKIQKDPIFKLHKALEQNFQKNVVPQLRTYYAKQNELMKTYVAGKYEMFPKEKHWANANSTLRVTYGKLEGSTPADGMQYTSHTTLDGVIEKFNTGNIDFELLPRMLELHKAKDFGEYAQDGELWVCFTGSNHTTGGNSGSPVIDANGYLMGLNFDRSWESTMSDFMFSSNRCRNITVDIRYVLWIMDKYANAKHLVDEMTIKRN